MIRIKRVASIVMILCLLGSFALAGKPTPTPAPPEVPQDVLQEVPGTIRELLDLAYGELIEANGQDMAKKNKYTRWRNAYEWGWCGGFVTWCMLELGVPQQEWSRTPKEEVSGIVHVKEGGVGKMFTGYQRMNRISALPQKGFIVVFGNSSSKYVKAGATPYYHVGLVWDLERLEDGRYMITTIEGNVSLDFTDAEGVRHKSPHTIRMYTRIFDPGAEKPNKNLTLVPEEERTQEESVTFSYGYTYNNPAMYVTCFLMPWVPGDPALEVQPSVDR